MIFQTCSHVVDTLERLRELYLKDNRVWIVMISMGKDSSSMACSIWNMLESLPIEQRTKDVHFITSDTLCEVPTMLEHVKTTVALMRKAAIEQQLPIHVHLVEPDMEHRFFYQVLGKGNPPPNERTRFRWCTDKMKIRPTNELVRQLSSTFTQLDEFDAVMFLGVRSEESNSRARSIQKHSFDDSYFAKHAVFSRILVCHPIRDWSADMVWEHLLNQSSNYLPWGSDPHELYELYRNASGECPLTMADGKQNKACSGSRFSCWTCCYNGPTDKMLVNLIESGDVSIRPLYLWKRLLYYVRNDIRFRLPLRRNNHQKLPSDTLLTFSFLDDVSEDLTYDPGSITVYARKLLLEMLLFIQKEVGYELIGEDEVLAIVQCWNEEGGRYTLADIQPQPLDHFNHLSFTKNGQINIKESDFQTLESRSFSISSQQLLEFHHRFNHESPTVVWIPADDYKSVTEYEVPNYISSKPRW